MQLLLKPEETAAALGVSRAKCYALIASGDLPTVHVGGCKRVPVAALQAWIDERTTSNAPLDRSAHAHG